MNEDGKPDIVVTNQNGTGNCAGGCAAVLLGNGDGTFQSAVVYETGGYVVMSMAIADVSLDGKPDLVLVNLCDSQIDCETYTGSASVSVLLGNGDGTFQSAVDYSSGGSMPCWWQSQT